MFDIYECEERCEDYKHDMYVDAKTYMSELQLRSKFCLWVLFLDSIKTFLLVVAQCLLDVLETSWFDVVQMVGENDSILHCVHSAGTCAWEQLEQINSNKSTLLLDQKRQ